MYRSLFLFVIFTLIAGCNSRKVTCDTVQYTSASLENQTNTALAITFCSNEVTIPKETYTIPANSPMQSYSAEIGVGEKEVEIPYADSKGDGCAKMGAGSEYLGQHSPVLSDTDLLTTKTCFNGNSFVFVAIGEGCPSDFNVFDQTFVECK